MALTDELQLLLARATGLARRGVASLRTRGLKHTLERARLQFAPRARPAPRPLLQADTRPFAPFAVPCADAPLASIVVPVHGQWRHTLGCLRAIAAHPPACPVEVVVVDDASPDDTATHLAQVEGLVVVRRATNGGFIAACNDGAARARGQYLVFLNNDTVPQPGWLDALLDTFSTHPDTGLAGAQLLYPDGRLQEAGGLVFRDGSAWNYGRFESPDDPRFSYVRATDYVSGAAAAIPRALFERIGGFDRRYAPAYYEDTDLAFAVREAGHAVRYQPAARVLHDEGTTAGSDPASGVKAWQARNRAVFAAHRAQALAALPGPGPTPSPATLHRRQRQVLVIDGATPRPDHDSASLRLVNLMRLLQAEGAHVVFLPADLAHAGRHTAALQALGIEAWYAPFAGRLSRWLREHGPRFDAVMVSRHYVLRELLPLLRRHAPAARIVFDSVDLHFVRERRTARLAGDEVLARSAEATRVRELEMVRASDATVVVSGEEAALLAREVPGAQVEVLSNVHEVAGPGLPFERRGDLVFVGGFRHPPNVDAARWFCREVFPRVRERLSAVRFHCIGEGPPDEIARLDGRDGIRVHGHVPDLAPYMDGCRVAVAPLRVGAGVKGKINLSMAHGQPVVATTLAAEGMHLCDGHDVLLADDAEAFADAVVRLYQDRALWQALAANGLESVRRHFSAEAARPALRRLFFAEAAR
ncbi:glycosyltransferase [Luteimonas wenzhouensis]|jgi:GT2 family glycosyltransferase|uniref:Glycosyltransferase n=1 Tax=Luteimonas wenzhouensis TaxID=2599615 RepID=A0A5C5U7X3_9GAMM|nr:glycosyltransferase [Luteimonas wenzhouensis]NLW95482.1 glycosyltransferase [Xanthomonadaceae bacterium]TWT21999.1 glycosyltransferase [Luteimonas wenzhouensis]